MEGFPILRKLKTSQTPKTKLTTYFRLLLSVAGLNSKRHCLNFKIYIVTLLSFPACFTCILIALVQAVQNTALLEYQVVILLYQEKCQDVVKKCIKAVFVQKNMCRHFATFTYFYQYQQRALLNEFVLNHIKLYITCPNQVWAITFDWSVLAT